MIDTIEDIVEDGQGNVVSRRVIAPGSAEHTARAVAKIDRELAETDTRLPRDSEDLWSALQKIATALGAGNVVPDAKKALIDRKGALRASRASLTGQ